MKIIIMIHCSYNLKSIIVHDGNTKSDHYYSIIRDIIYNKWILYDDNIIKIKNTLDLEIECFWKNESIYSEPNCLYFIL